MNHRNRIEQARNHYEEDDSQVMGNDPNLLAKTFGIAILLFLFMFAGWWLIITYPKQFFGFNAALLVISVIVWGARRTYKIVTNK